MKPQGEKSYLKTTKKGNVTINPKKEELMSEHLRKRIQTSVEDLREAAKKKDKEAKKKVKRWWDDDGDGIGYEPHEVKKEEASPAATVDDSDAKKKAKDRMKQKMMQATIDHDRAKKYGLK